MKYHIQYELEVEADDLKQLNQKLSLAEMQLKIRDKNFKKAVFDDDGWYVATIKQGETE